MPDDVGRTVETGHRVDRAHGSVERPAEVEGHHVREPSLARQALPREPLVRERDHARREIDAHGLDADRGEGLEDSAGPADRLEQRSYPGAAQAPDEPMPEEEEEEEAWLREMNALAATDVERDAEKRPGDTR